MYIVTTYNINNDTRDREIYYDKKQAFEYYNSIKEDNKDLVVRLYEAKEISIETFNQIKYIDNNHWSFKNAWKNYKEMFNKDEEIVDEVKKLKKNIKELIELIEEDEKNDD